MKIKSRALALDGSAGGVQVPCSQSSIMATKTVPPPESSGRSPFSGCLIFIAAISVMVFLIGFSTFVLFRQYAEIEKFTDTEPAPRGVISIQDHEGEMVELAQSLEVFRQQLKGDKPTTLGLSPRQINLAIAAYEPLDELRGTFEVLTIGPEHMEIAISFPLNGKPRLTRGDEQGWITSDSRHLNAIIEARPALLQHEVILEILEIRPANQADVPREFIELMSPYRITERYLDQPVLGPAMAALTRVGLEDGALTFTREPGVAPVDFISDDAVDAGARRFLLFFGVGSSLFLIFAATILFIGMRNAKKTVNRP